MSGKGNGMAVVLVGAVVALAAFVAYRQGYLSGIFGAPEEDGRSVEIDASASPTPIRSVLPPTITTTSPANQY